MPTRNFEYDKDKHCSICDVKGAYLVDGKWYCWDHFIKVREKDNEP